MSMFVPKGGAPAAPHVRAKDGDGAPGDLPSTRAAPDGNPMPTGAASVGPGNSPAGRMTGDGIASGPGVTGEAAWVSQAEQPAAFRAAQRDALDAFRQASDGVGLEKLGAGHYRARAGDAAVVLRLHDYDAREANVQHVPFDAFASDVLAALDVPALTVERVPEGHPAIDALKQYPDRNRDPILRQQGGVTPVRASMHAAVALPAGETLTRTLAADLRASLVIAKDHLERFVNADDRVAADLKDQWNRLTPAAQGIFLADLRAVDPNARVSERNPAGALVALAKKSTPETLQALHDRMWKHVPKSTQGELARAWAGLTVLGAQDTGPHKWSLAGDRVVVTNLAERSEAAARGEQDIALRLDPTVTFDGSLQTRHRQYGPLSRLPLSDALRDRLLAALPPTMVAQLEALNDGEIRRFADASGYRLFDDREAEAYAERARGLVDAHRAVD